MLLIRAWLTMTGLSESSQEEIVRSATFALLAAIYLDVGLAPLSVFVSQHVFPPLLKLRDRVDVMQPVSPLDQLSAALTSYRYVSIILFMISIPHSSVWVERICTYINRQGRFLTMHYWVPDI